ncbi:MAG: cation diffusion facilitator family transporter, partial [Nitrosopumilus sp.]|nr:cation diffusion facilitator family transporter [Nitrosopumilus sp.]NNL52884.1 cation transporter [Nitrosopumilus sp.]
MHDREKNIKFAVILNIGFTAFEIVGSILTNSLALLSDAIHDAGDSIALTSSLVLEKKAKKGPDKIRTFGYGRLSLFSAVISAIFLVAGSVFILSQAIPRILNPEHVDGFGMMWIAVIGITINFLAFLKVRRGQSVNENIISWHMLEDVLGWIAILFGSILIQFWDNHQIDSLLTIGITAFIMFGVFKNLRKSINIFLQGVPEHIDMDKVRNTILSIKGVKNLHDVHVWSIDGENNIFTGHIVIDTNSLKYVD